MDAFEELWTTKLDEYVLIKSEDGKNLSDYTIFHLATQTVLIIEDDDQYELAIKNMLRSGARVLDAIPTG